MQTFLPYSSYILTAKCLDYRRLGKQRVECKQILQCLLGTGSLRWKNHPAVKMWKGYEESLAMYGYEICVEWISRGYKDSLKIFFGQYLDLMTPDVIDPPWMGNEAFHASHRSNLIRKFPEHYSKFCWRESGDLPYVWPV